MRGATIDVTTKLVTEQCCECGVLFALPQELRGQLLKLTTKGSFYCPNGHSQHYVGESDEAKIKRLEREAESLREYSEYAWRQVDAAVFEQKRLKREARKAQRRAAAAVCPVPGCKRQIQQMQRHLTTKHKDWVAEHVHNEGDQ